MTYPVLKVPLNPNQPTERPWTIGWELTVHRNWFRFLFVQCFRTKTACCSFCSNFVRFWPTSI